MLFDITITDNINKLIANLTPGNMRLAIRAGLLNVVETAEAYAAPETPVSTSHLVNSETAFMKDDFTGILRATADYAKYVHEGTGIYGPHHQKIVPTDKKALAFRASWGPGRGKKGLTVLRSVKGMKPNPFFTRARKRFKPADVFAEGVKGFLLRRLQ